MPDSLSNILTMSSRRETKTNGQSTNPRRTKRVQKMVDGVGDMETMTNAMKMDGPRWLGTDLIKK